MKALKLTPIIGLSCPTAVKILVLLSFTSIYFFQPCFSQTTSSQRRVVGQFIHQQEVYIYEFRKLAIDNYTFSITSIVQEADDADVDSAKKDSTGKPVLKLDSATIKKKADSTAKKKKEDDTIKEYRFADFQQQAFSSAFQQQMKIKFKTILSKDSLQTLATEIFFKIQAKLEFIDDEPITSYLVLRKDIIYSFLKSLENNFYKADLAKPLAKHLINNVSVEMEAGTIKNISVYLVKPNAPKTEQSSPRSVLEFKNRYPISISGKFDPEKLTEVNLYCNNCAGIKGLSRFIRLSDLIRLDLVYSLQKDDYSPADVVVDISPSKPIEALRKEKRSKILELAAFTDAVGLSEDQPNGIIQIEAKRKINIITKYIALKGTKANEDQITEINLSDVTFSRNKPNTSTWQEGKPDEEEKDIPGKEFKYYFYQKSGEKKFISEITVQRKKFRTPYYNYLGYIEPRLLYSKIEDNNKFLILDDAAHNPTNIRSLNLFQYQIASFGVMLNGFKIIFPQAKFTLNLADVSLNWYRTRAKFASDTAGKKSDALNVGYWSTSINATFRPDSRWGANVGMTYIKQAIFNEKYTIDHKGGLLQPYFESFIKTNEDSKLFFRFRWTMDADNSNRNFTQVQFGYSMNLFGSSQATK